MIYDVTAWNAMHSLSTFVTTDTTAFINRMSMPYRCLDKSYQTYSSHGTWYLLGSLYTLGRRRMRMLICIKLCGYSPTNTWHQTSWFSAELRSRQCLFLYQHLISKTVTEIINARWNFRRLLSAGGLASIGGSTSVDVIMTEFMAYKLILYML